MGLGENLLEPVTGVLEPAGGAVFELAAGPAGLYFEGIAGTGDYVFQASPTGSVRRHADVDIDAPLALADGNVYLLAIHENQGGDNYLDAFGGSTLGALFPEHVASNDGDIAGTGIGLLVLGWPAVRLLNTANGHSRATVSVPGAVILIPGPSAAVVTVSHGTTYLLWLAR